ncbi:MAG TPA: hypothetical protein VF322_04225 [Gammaproteobacteria bacterium]
MEGDRGGEWHHAPQRPPVVIGEVEKQQPGTDPHQTSTSADPLRDEPGRGVREEPDELKEDERGGWKDVVPPSCQNCGPTSLKVSHTSEARKIGTQNATTQATYPAGNARTLLNRMPVAILVPRLESTELCRMAE